MARVSFVLTEDERHAFQDALGEASAVAGMPLPPDALAVLATAGLRPTVSTVAGLMHQIITTGFDQPLEFDPGYHLETLDGDGTVDKRSTQYADTSRTFAFDATPSVANSVKFLLFLLAGPYCANRPTSHPDMIIRTAQRIVEALEVDVHSGYSNGNPSKITD